MAEKPAEKEGILSINLQITGQASEDSSPSCKRRVRAGEICPTCKIGVIDYDGLLNLYCSICGVVETGSFT